MRYRLLGKTEYSISEIGFAAEAIGRTPRKGGGDEESIRSLRRAIDLGINFIDTALSYGDGRSERLIGKVLLQSPRRIYVATKIPPKNRQWPVQKGTPLKEVYPKEQIIACTERSLRNLGVERIDLQQLHVWAPNWTEEIEWYDTFRKLQREGKIAHFGISVSDHEPDSALEIVASGLIDTIHVDYNIFNPTAALSLFPLCEEKNIGVIVRSPYDKGALTGNIDPQSRFEPGDWRKAYFTARMRREIAARVEKLEVLLREAGADNMMELARRFCLSNRAVSTVIAGMHKIEHVYGNLPFFETRPLSADVLKKLSLHAWPKKSYRSDPGSSMIGKWLRGYFTLENLEKATSYGNVDLFR